MSATPLHAHSLHRETKNYLFAFSIANLSLRRYGFREHDVIASDKRYCSTKLHRLPRRSGSRVGNSIAPSDFELIQVSGDQDLQLLFGSELGIYVLWTTKPAAWGPRVDLLVIFTMFQYMYTRLLSYSHLQPQILTRCEVLWAYTLGNSGPMHLLYGESSW